MGNPLLSIRARKWAPTFYSWWVGGGKGHSLFLSPGALPIKIMHGNGVVRNGWMHHSYHVIGLNLPRDVSATSPYISLGRA